MQNAASHVLMVPPEGFQYNIETASSNAFQQTSEIQNLAERAMDEFNTMKQQLEQKGIKVLILHQDKGLPDAVFPNNWFSTHKNANGKTQLIIYPMLTANRQAEVNIEGLVTLLEKHSIHYDEIIDLRDSTKHILEGTGSLVLDKMQRILYACLSPRTSEALVNKVAKLLDYQPVLFHSTDDNRHPIYHTNVIMAVTNHHVLLCLESIRDSVERQRVVQAIARSNKEIIELSLSQVQHMCGNVLELHDANNRSILVLSARALEHLTTKQIEILERYSELLPVAIPTIETVGGGSARCMLAEIVLKR